MQYIIEFYVLRVGSQYYSHELQPKLTTWSTNEDELIRLGDKWLRKTENHITAKRFIIRQLNSDGTSRLLYTGE